MIRLLNRLISVDDNRLTKCVFNLDYTAAGKTWCSDLKHLLHQVNMQKSFENKQIVNLEHVKIYLIISTNKNGMKNCIMYQNSEPI